MIKTILLLAIFLNFISSILVIGKQENSWKNRLFCVLSFSASIWAFANYMTSIQYDHFWLEATYASSAFVIAIGVLWSLSVAHRQMARGLSPAIILCSVVFAGFSFVPSFIAHSYSAIHAGGIFEGVGGPGIYIFAVLFSVAIFISLLKLLEARKKEIDPKRKLQLLYIFLGFLFIFSLAALTNFILPRLGIYTFGTVPSIGFLLFLVCTAYSIIKPETFNAKILAADLGIFSLWALMLVQAFAASTLFDQITSVLLLTISIVVGIQLRRSVARELQQKEKLEAALLSLKFANEKLKKLNALKTEFLSFATHQLQSPLMTIDGYASMLDADTAESFAEKKKKVIKPMREAIRHLAVTVEDFLNISKIEAGGLSYEMHNFDLNALVAAAVQEKGKEASVKGLSLQFIPAGSLAHSIKGDERKLRQVIFNLLDNAIKYTQKGTVEVSLANTDKGELQIKIADTGIGMTQETIEKIFDKFKRGENGMKAASGSGIGLYLAHEIIEAHHGRIWAESKGEGEGSQFYISLPVAKIATEAS